MTSRIHSPRNPTPGIVAAPLVTTLMAALAPRLAPTLAPTLAMVLLLAAPRPAHAESSAVAPGVPTPITQPAATPETTSRIPLRIALQTEAAFGVLKGSFYNHLLGARLDLRFSPRVSFGGYLGYANLKGKDGRAHSALPYAQVEYMAGDPASLIRVPLRFASGYLPGNGPVVRAATGLAFALGSNVDLVTELVAPMVWLTNNQMLLSLNLALELAIKL